MSIEFFKILEYLRLIFQHKEKNNHILFGDVF